MKTNSDNKRVLARFLLTAVIFMLCFSTLISCKQSSSEIAILSSSMSYIYSRRTYTYQGDISGEFKNVSDKDFAYVSIVFDIFDKNGNKIGEAMDYKWDIAKGETYKYMAISDQFSSEPAKYKLQKIETTLADSTD